MNKLEIYREIAKELGLSYHTVQVSMSISGLKGHISRKTVEPIEAAAKRWGIVRECRKDYLKNCSEDVLFLLRNTTACGEEIGRLFGFSGDTVYNIAHANGITRKERSAKWVHGKHTCPACGKLFISNCYIDGKGHGICCSRKCRSVYERSLNPIDVELEKVILEKLLSSRISSRIIAKDLGVELRTVLLVYNRNNVKRPAKPREYTEPCRNCGKKTETTDRKRQVGKNRMFCSRKCQNEFRSGKTLSEWRIALGKPGETSHEYRELWKKAIHKRDGGVCALCWGKGKKLNAHHIKMHSKYPGLTYELDNGITLCEDCHKSIRCEEDQFEYMLSFEAEFARLTR